MEKLRTTDSKLSNIKKIFKKYDLTVQIIRNGSTRMKVTLLNGNELYFYRIVKAYFKHQNEHINSRNYILKF